MVDNVRGVEKDRATVNRDGVSRLLILAHSLSSFSSCLGVYNIVGVVVWCYGVVVAWFGVVAITLNLKYVGDDGHEIEHDLVGEVGQDGEGAEDAEVGQVGDVGEVDHETEGAEDMQEEFDVSSWIRSDEEAFVSEDEFMDVGVHVDEQLEHQDCEVICESYFKNSKMIF
ncbi:uncharacterized protein HKW66_Vig0175180 [Vigna angularis]|uniref:Uncharacterized protein n=1 Tax=Phaseolus angularis TaxID=3914 RepID=A0A8T0JQT3_PHAAN|nr:uncharacterized protein HKW66_Vig0175180 [Vigna angularis]